MSVSSLTFCNFSQRAGQQSRFVHVLWLTCLFRMQPLLLTVMTQSSRCSEARLDGAICRSRNGDTSVPSGSGRMLCCGVSQSPLPPSLKQLTDLEASSFLLKPEDVRVQGRG